MPCVEQWGGLKSWKGILHVFTARGGVPSGARDGFKVLPEPGRALKLFQSPGQQKTPSRLWKGFEALPELGTA